MLGAQLTRWPPPDKAKSLASEHGLIVAILNPSRLTPRYRPLGWSAMGPMWSSGQKVEQQVRAVRRNPVDTEFDQIH